MEGFIELASGLVIRLPHMRRWSLFLVRLP